MSLRSASVSAVTTRLIATLLFAFGVVESAGGAEPQKQVLALYATRRDARISVIGDRDLPRLLASGPSGSVDYYSEFIDQIRFSQSDYQAAFREFLKLKYKEHAFDLVLAMDSVSLQFVEMNRSELFPGTPVVFFVSRPVSKRPPNSTGVVGELNLVDTLELAMKLQPDVRHVYVVGDREAGNGGYEKTAREQFRPFESRLSITYLSGLPTAQLDALLKNLPDHSIVYYTVVYRDGLNQNFNPLAYLDRVASIANAPTYCWVDSAMDLGVVGGSLRSLDGQVRSIADQAIRVLRGEPADSIPIYTPDLQVRQVDWRQLRRWGISEARIPAGTIVRFRNPSAWDRYRGYILGGIAVVLAQALLIAGLLMQRVRRRRAESHLLSSQNELRTSYNRIRDLGGRLIAAQEQERARVARELHDDIGQQVAVLTMDLQLLSRNDSVQPGDSQRVAGAFDRAQNVGRSLRDLSHRLHPENLRLVGLVAALGRLQREACSPEVTVTFSHDQVPAALPDHLALCLFRIAQEALRNAVAHGHARKVSIRVGGGRDAIVLTVTDDGVGFDEGAARPGLGLVSMSERAQQVGGALHIQSRPGHGTQVEIRVPLDFGAADAISVS